MSWSQSRPSYWAVGRSLHLLALWDCFCEVDHPLALRVAVGGREMCVPATVISASTMGDVGPSAGHSSGSHSALLYSLSFLICEVGLIKSSSWAVV